MLVRYDIGIGCHAWSIDVLLSTVSPMDLHLAINFKRCSFIWIGAFHQRDSYCSLYSHILDEKPTQLSRWFLVLFRQLMDHRLQVFLLKIFSFLKSYIHVFVPSSKVVLFLSPFYFADTGDWTSISKSQSFLWSNTEILVLYLPPQLPGFHHMPQSPVSPNILLHPCGCGSPQYLMLT